MGKRVALVNPGKNKPWASILPPMNLGYIAAYLEKHGVDVHIVDELAGQNVNNALHRIRPDIVGITATTALVNDAYRLARVSRDMGITTVMGGVHASFMTLEALDHVDIVVRGEGERAMLDIVNGNRSPIIKAPYIRQLDDIPMPSWHLMDMKFYLNSRDRFNGTHIDFVPRGARIGSIMTVRGCPYSCIFCCNSWRDTPVRFHSTERVLSDIRFLVDNYTIDALYFAEDDFFINKKRVETLCGMMQENGFNLLWSCQGRSDTVTLESLQTARKAGCRQVQFGFESGSQRILDILKNKTTTVEQNRQALRMCREAGIRSFATFILGNPTETIDDLEATIKFIKENEIDQAGVLVTTPFPGTKLWEWCEEQHLIPDHINYSDLITSEVSISACNTIPTEVINKYAREIRSYLNPLTPGEAMRKILRQPAFLLKAIRDPAQSFSMAALMIENLKQKYTHSGSKGL